MDISKATKKELQDEVSRLQLEIKALEETEWAEAEERSQARVRYLRNLGIGAVDLLAPEHGRSTCNDEDISNTWGSAENGTFRCLRCALLDIALHGYEPSGVVVFEINIVVHRKKR